jgi:hypothetical protein
MDRKLLIISVSLVIIALVSVPVMAAPSPNSNPVDQILTIVKDIQTKVNTIITNLGFVQDDVKTIKTTTDTINSKLNAADSNVQILTRSKGKTYSIGTSSGWHRPVIVELPDYTKAADFRVMVCAEMGGSDFTPEDGDTLRVKTLLEAALNAPIYTLLEKEDSELGEGCWHVDMTGSYMEIDVNFAEPLTQPDQVVIFYSYTVITESGVTIKETFDSV